MSMECTRWIKQLGLAVAGLAGATLVASCGGGTEQIEPFAPTQMIVLGDESNLLASDGKRFGINGLDTNNVFDCRLLPVWTQSLAGAFGFISDRCNPDASTRTNLVMRAALNAKAADLDAQIDAQIAVAALTAKDLFTVLVGTHDIIELYEQFPGPKQCDLSAARARGHHVAEQINRLIRAGARVLVSTVPDLGLSPYALALEAANPGQAALLSCLTAAFNARVRVDIIQDGRSVGLMLTDDLVFLMARSPASYGLSNGTEAACTVALPDCTSATLVTGATPATHLWADDRRVGPAVHSQLAILAHSRARNNPF